MLQQLPFYQLVPTSYHEAFHQYLHFYVGRGTPIPLWFNEGMASYFEQMQETRGAKKKLDHKLIDNRQLRMIQQKIITRTAIPLSQLVAAGHEEFHPADDKQKEGLYYTQSFSIIYFFMQGMGGKPVFQFAEELKKTKSVDAANEKVFGKELKNLKKHRGEVEAVHRRGADRGAPTPAISLRTISPPSSFPWARLSSPSLSLSSPSAGLRWPGGGSPRCSS